MASLLLVVAWIVSLLSVPVRCVDPTLNVPACSSQFDTSWAFNSKGQSPCTLAGYLGSVCTNNTFTINAITSTENYVLTTPLANNCTCSSVYYSALSACATCQGGGDLSFKQWATNCSTVFTIYPSTIPDGTAVPHWAFQSYPFDNSTFNATLAQLTGDTPESSAPAPSNTASNTNSAPAATSSSTTSESKGKSKAGAIAGGVVGGLAFVIIAAIVVLLFLRRRRRKGAMNKERQPLDDDDGAITTPTPFMVNDSMRSSTPPMRLYNPSDPTTYPPSHGLMASDRTQSPDTQISALSPMTHYRSLSDSTTGHYTGAAEI